MKDKAFARNTGHFDIEIELAGSEGLECRKVDSINFQESFRILRLSPCYRALRSMLKQLDLLKYWKQNTAFDFAPSEGLDGMKVDNIKPQMDPFVFPVGLCTS